MRDGDILLEARILTVADVVESMASHRPYRPALGIEAALEEIAKNRAILYDADAVDACLKLFRKEGYVLVKQGLLNPIKEHRKHNAGLVPAPSGPISPVQRLTDRQSKRNGSSDRKHPVLRRIINDGYR